MVTFRRDTLSRDGQVILRDVNLHIEDGERIVILGASGAGKTTLLNALYSEIAPAAALIPQPHGLVEPLNVRQNIALGRIDQQSLWRNLRSLCRMPATEKSEIGSIATRLDLAPQISQSVNTLSGGQKSRVAIARALYRGGPLLLADEPCAALDPDRSRLVLEEIAERFQTLVCTMHDVDAGLRLASRIIGIADQRIAFDLPPAELSSQQLDLLYAQQNEPTIELPPPEIAQAIQRPCL